MILYLDTSALVKVYAEEAHSDDVRAAAREAEAVATHTIAYVEARATLARKAREQHLAPGQLARCKEDLDSDWEAMDIIGITDELRLRAANLAEQYGLRGFDSVHLAAAELTHRATPPGSFRFAVFDGRLARAATAHGLPLLL